MSGKNWFVTGVSRGFGHAIARAALDDGDIVVGTARHGGVDLPNTDGRLHLLQMDLGDPTQIRETVAKGFRNR